MHMILSAVTTGGSVRADQTSYNMEYTFEVFVCVAILLLHKEQFMQSPEPGDLYTCVNRWVCSN